MSMRVGRRLLGAAIAVVAALSLAVPALAQPKIKIGVIFDLTGPLAGGGSELHHLGAKIMIDYFTKQGGVDVSKGNEAGAKKAGFNIVLKEGYSATAPDLSALVTKLKRARPDVIFHTGYNPDITLFHRQARENGLKVSALIGHGAGYGVYAKLKEGLGNDVNYFYNTDPISIWL